MYNFLQQKKVNKLVQGTGFLILAFGCFNLPAQAFTLSLNPQFGTTENTGATANVDFNFVDTVQGVKLNLSVLNTTNGTVGLGATQATLVGVAFDVPDVINTNSLTYDSTGSNFTRLFKPASLPPYGTFDLGISPPRTTFAGGNPNQGLTAGQSTSVSFLFTGIGQNATQVENSFKLGFEDSSLRVVGRFQQVNAGGGSDKVLGDYVPVAVPEPSIIGGSILGLTLLGKFRHLVGKKTSKLPNNTD